MLKTRLTELLGVRYPIISAPMVRMSGGCLAAAVSAAGGLGTFGGISPATPTGPDYIRDQIGDIRSQTDQPFGVGFITHFIPLAPQNFDTALEEKVPVILFSFADPHPWLRRAKESGALTVCQVQTLEAARRAVAAGADILAAQGNEAGGHTGAMHLLPFLVCLIEEFPTIPVIAPLQQPSPRLPQPPGSPTALSALPQPPGSPSPGFRPVRARQRGRAYCFPSRCASAG